MRDAQPKAIHLRDYEVPRFIIEKTELHFNLLDESTLVKSLLTIRRNPASSDQSHALELQGQDLVLKSVAINGQELDGSHYTVGPDTLNIHSVPESFQLECVTEIFPHQNTSLEGLYQSNHMYCTQCEAEGFRKITYYLDRPDVLSVFTTRIEADKARYPVLLSNGNNIDSGELENGRHWVVWEDPFRKPAYLFALVAGDLEYVEDRFTTMYGREVLLRIYVEAKDINKCSHAMGSLKRAMEWDEEVYGREYDLDIFNIVAVDDFNMGAMENKSLNIFNTSCVLADPETTTDAGFQRVEAVVAHEYFHNWSGNRVTCRDWFQLSLKEGFTVYRDAEFSSDTGSRTVKRVEDVSLLRTVQFAEDSGPMAHPVRPDSYIEISNFYTVTIYEKGAEVVRMIANLLGPDNFRRGSDLYFERHDGQAVTCDDFVKAMEDASGVDLSQFSRWYFQAGTPRLDVQGEYDETEKTYTMTVRQSCPATPGQERKLPFHIPMAIALFGSEGALPLQVRGADSASISQSSADCVLEIKDPEQVFVFENVSEKPVPSLLRGFSAPVKLSFDYERDDLMFLMSRDSDGFSRWDASQQLGVRVLNDLLQAQSSEHACEVDGRLIEGYRRILADSDIDKSMVALMLKLPTEAYMVELGEKVDVAAIHGARLNARLAIARQLEDELWNAYRSNLSDESYEPSASQIAARSLKNAALSYLMLLETPEALVACTTQFDNAHNMTDVMAALYGLIGSSFNKEKESATKRFYQRWSSEPLVVNQWFAAQAQAPVPGTLGRVKQLMEHAAFDIKNPNKVRAVVGTFCNQNLINFHQNDGSGYRFLADQVLVINQLNPQIAARLLTPLTRWKKYNDASASMMKAELQRIMEEPALSKDVYEVVSKTLLP